MERLRERIQVAKKALATLLETIEIKEPSSIVRDASIQRFEYSFEACWKAGKLYLFDHEGLDVGSPKSVIRSFREIGIFSEQETILGLNMVNDRNLTVHTYNEGLAEKINKNIPKYFTFMDNWIERMEQDL